jgi:glycosyltransferase involved in cell wall biosynthesis
VCYLFCGKFEEKKHPLELLRAFNSSVKSANNIHLLMVGDGELRAECEAYARAHDLPVTFTGFLNQSEIAEAYGLADCLVLASDAGETWGLVVNEAMACGLPAIVSELVGCASDLVIPGQTGAVFSFGEWNELSSLMVKLAELPEDLQIMGVRAKARVSDYSPETAAQGVLNAVTKLVEARSKA